MHPEKFLRIGPGQRSTNCNAMNGSEMCYRRNHVIQINWRFNFAKIRNQSADIWKCPVLTTSSSSLLQMSTWNHCWRLTTRRCMIQLQDELFWLTFRNDRTQPAFSAWLTKLKSMTVWQNLYSLLMILLWRLSLYKQYSINTPVVLWVVCHLSIFSYNNTDMLLMHIQK